MRKGKHKSLQRSAPQILEYKIHGNESRWNLLTNSGQDYTDG